MFRRRIGTMWLQGSSSSSPAAAGAASRPARTPEEGASTLRSALRGPGGHDLLDDLPPRRASQGSGRAPSRSPPARPTPADQLPEEPGRVLGQVSEFEDMAGLATSSDELETWMTEQGCSGEVATYLNGTT